MATKGKDKAGLKWSAEEKPVKLDKWDGAAVKNALDDAIKKVLVDKYGYVESHRLMDGRLAICTISVAFAAFALIWDYLHPFPKSRPTLIFCVLSYFVMMAILTLYTTITEKGIFLLALDKDKAGVDPDNVWSACSQLKRYDDLYTIELTYKDGITKECRTATFKKSVASFFDEDGLLLTDLFDPEIEKLHDSLSAQKKEN